MLRQERSQPGEKGIAKPWMHRNPKGPTGRATLVPDIRLRIFDILQYSSAVSEIQRSFIRQVDSSRRTVKQRKAQAGLERGDDLAHAGRGNAKALSGGDDALLLGNLHKIGNGPKLVHIYCLPGEHAKISRECHAESADCSSRWHVAVVHELDSGEFLSRLTLGQ